MFFVESEKVRIILKSCGKAGFGHGISAPYEVVYEVDATQDEIVPNRNADLLAEEVADVVFAVVKSVRNARERYIFGVVCVQILQNLKNEFIFDARCFIGRLSAEGCFAYRGKQLDRFAAKKYRVRPPVPRCVCEYFAHQSVAAYLSETVGAEDIADSVLPFKKRTPKSVAVNAEAVGDIIADMKRNALKNLAVGYRTSVELGGVEDYHIACAECVESSLDPDLTASSQKKQEDKGKVKAFFFFFRKSIAFLKKL